MANDVDWLEPWWSTATQGEEFHEGFKRQLKTEVGPEHPLYNIDARIVARGYGDDTLFQLLDGSGRFAVVHLTWRQSQEPMPWPVTEIHSSFQSFVTDRMIPEHAELLVMIGII
jgi:hypothetical protein